MTKKKVSKDPVSVVRSCLPLPTTSYPIASLVANMNIAKPQVADVVALSDLSEPYHMT